MARPDQHTPKRRQRRGPAHARKDPRPQPPTPTAPSRTDAPGDEPLTLPCLLTLQTPFAISRALAKRLQRRQINPKEAFTIRDASGAWFRASLKEYSPGGGLALPYERMDRSPEPIIDITLACAVLARQRMILVMQKATELGVMRIIPLLTDHSVPAAGLEHEQAHAWPAHVIRAARQCRRASLPHVLPPMPLDALLATPVYLAAELRLFLDDRSAPAPQTPSPPRSIVLLVGPEGGFSDAERARLAEKARPWVLGGRVLRAETAVIVGLTAIHMTCGDFALPQPPATRAMNNPAPAC